MNLSILNSVSYVTSAVKDLLMIQLLNVLKHVTKINLNSIKIKQNVNVCKVLNMEDIKFYQTVPSFIILISFMMMIYVTKIVPYKVIKLYSN